MRENHNSRTAAEAGWHVSRYNLFAPVPGTDQTAVANLFKGTCARYSPAEIFLLDNAESLDESHPILEHFAERGLIVNFDELQALQSIGRCVCGAAPEVNLTVCPTMACNFACPYCFEEHRSGKMSQEVQDDVLELTRRMLKASHAKSLVVTWFGGEPLLVPDVIETLSQRFMALAEEFNASYHADLITNGYLLTQPVADMLERCKVRYAQITLDGVGPAHDATRHLAGGGATFNQIADNLRSLKLPFKVEIRHNVHGGNRDQVPLLRQYVADLARESGNRITYYPTPVAGNPVSAARGSEVQLLERDASCGIGIERDCQRFSHGRGYFCGAQMLFALCIDETGRLYKCWEDVDKPERSFGTAGRWKPGNPIGTADHPDALTVYLNTALPLTDPECMECVWLPACVGGCPNKRLFTHRDCLPYRDAPEAFVLALAERLENAHSAKPIKEDVP